MSTRYQIAETDTFRKPLKKNIEYQRMYGKIKEYVYPLLRESPHFGPNIKRLKGTLSQYYRYRLGDYRLFYAINEDQLIVFVASLRHRSDA